MLSKFEKYGNVVEFGPVFYFSLVHKHETLQKGKNYGNKISIICTFVSYIYGDQKHLIKEDNKKINCWHQSILGNWFRKFGHIFPTLDRYQKPMKLNLHSMKIVENVKQNYKRKKPNHWTTVGEHK
jgi:hypothetical protein